MNIVFAGRNQNFVGLYAVTQLLKYDSYLWLPEKKPLFDMFDEIHPNILFVEPHHINTLMLQALEEYKNTQLIVCGEYAIDNNSNILNIQIQPAANIVQFSKGVYNHKYSSDVFYWSSQPINHMEYLYYISKKLPIKLRVCGDVQVTIVEYLGRVSTKEIVDYMCSSKINLSFDYNNLLDAAANKVFAITNLVNEYFPVFSNNEELENIINKFVKSEKLRQQIIKTTYNEVMNSETYFHRWAELGDILGIAQWRPMCMNMLNRYRS